MDWLFFGTFLSGLLLTIDSAYAADANDASGAVNAGYSNTVFSATEAAKKEDNFYFGENGVKKDYKQAAFWYTKAAE